MALHVLVNVVIPGGALARPGPPRAANPVFDTDRSMVRRAIVKALAATPPSLVSLIFPISTLCWPGAAQGSSNLLAFLMSEGGAPAMPPSTSLGWWSSS